MTLILRNGEQSATFLPHGGDGGYRPEWIRAGVRPMLRFKDHEWLNFGQMRVVEGRLVEQSGARLLFGGDLTFATAAVRWCVEVRVPDDGRPGFLVTTRLAPLDEPIEFLEAFSTFEVP